MIRILLDTNAYAAFKRGLAEAVAIIQKADVVALTPVVLGELLGGFAAGAKERQNRAELTAFLSAPRVWVAPVDGVNRRAVRPGLCRTPRRGHTDPHERHVDRGVRPSARPAVVHV